MKARLRVLQYALNDKIPAAKLGALVNVRRYTNAQFHTLVRGTNWVVKPNLSPCSKAP